MTVTGHKTIRLKPATIARLEAACQVMGLSSADALAERIILESLPTIEHEDLLDDPQAQQQENRHG